MVDLKPSATWTVAQRQATRCAVVKHIVPGLAMIAARAPGVEFITTDPAAILTHAPWCIHRISSCIGSTCFSGGLHCTVSCSGRSTRASDGAHHTGSQL